MSQVAGATNWELRRPALLYAPVQEELDQVEILLRRELRSDVVFVNDVIRHSARIAGKRLRPALLLLAAKATGSVSEEHLVLSAVVEMIHTATLIHDDVLDEATLRRHVATVNARWNNQTSVLLGDYLFTHAFYLASTLPSTYACRSIGQATNIVCEGELRQTGNCGNFEMTEREYLDIIQAKTAALCSCCCALGAHFAGAEPDLEASMAQFGRDLGMAFQIADDLLDLLGDEQHAGKSLGTDLAKRKPTLPIIHLLQQVACDQRSELLTLLASGDNGHQRDVRVWLDRFESVSYARAVAESYANRARAQLADLPSSPSKSILEDLTRFAAARQH
jgi:octaprenyl-diphosphate synthase